MKNLPWLPILVGIQPDHWKSSLQNFEDRYPDGFYKKLEKLAKDIVEDTLTQRYVFLTGAPGSGKTHYMVGLFRARAAVDSGVLGAEHALYMPFNTLVTEIIEGFSETHSTRVGLQKYLPIKYFFVDDISRGEKVINPDKLEGQLFKELLLDRFENARHLVATSNYNKTELLRMTRAVFGEYVSSRVAASSLFLEFPDKDFRKANHDTRDVRKDNKQ